MDFGHPNTLEHSNAIFQSILLHLLKPNKISIQISHHLLKHASATFQSVLLHLMNSNGVMMKISQQVMLCTTPKYGHPDDWLPHSLRCRQMIGDPWADSLQLPLHPTLLGRLRMKVDEFVYSFMLSCYTWAGHPWSPLRGHLVEFHRRLASRFIDKWQESHGTRMGNILEATNACPFAMVT